MQLDDTGERMVPEHHDGLLLYAEHVIRYQAASELVRGKTVLDIASGSGYGSAILGRTAAQVYGMDASDEAVAYAQSKFATTNVSFSQADATSIPLPDASVDVVITFETIEHVEDYRAFVAEIRRVLRPEGVAIVSTPNDLEFAEGNHFHLHEFEKDELLSLLEEHFEHIDEYYQATWKYVALDRLSALQQPELAIRTLNLAPLASNQSLYFYFVCSARDISEQISALGALGEHYSDRDLSHERTSNDSTIAALRSELHAIKASRSYRLAESLAAVKRRAMFWN